MHRSHGLNDRRQHRWRRSNSRLEKRAGGRGVADRTPLLQRRIAPRGGGARVADDAPTERQPLRGCGDADPAKGFRGFVKEIAGTVAGVKKDGFEMRPGLFVQVLEAPVERTDIVDPAIVGETVDHEVGVHRLVDGEHLRKAATDVAVADGVGEDRLVLVDQHVAGADDFVLEDAGRLLRGH